MTPVAISTEGAAPNKSEAPQNADSTVVEGVVQNGGATTVSITPSAPVGEVKLPEGFKTVDELVAKYTELTATPAVTTPAAAPSKQTLITTPAQAQEAAKAAGVDLDVLAKEILDGGELSDASVTALNAKGIDRSVVDNYAASQQILRDNAVKSLHTHVGGEQNFQALLNFGASLPAAEVESYNTMLKTSEVAAKAALDSLKARFELVNGTDRWTVDGEARATHQGPKPFQSNAQVIAAMQDPRYKKDEAYRAEVMARLRVS